MTKLSAEAGPLYEKVKDYVRERIATGAFTGDGRLPSEHDLVATLGVSRMTVHRALRELTQAGVLVRVAGVGTFVAPPRPQSALLEIRNIADEIRGRGHAHRAELLLMESVRTPPELTLAFEFSRPRRVFHSLVVHHEDGRPVQLEERFVNPDIAPHYDAQDFSTQTTFDYLQRQAPVTEVEHVISAIAADPSLAARLALSPGEPCLKLNRRTWSAGRIATVNAFIWAGERASLGSRYRPD